MSRTTMMKTKHKALLLGSVAAAAVAFASVVWGGVVTVAATDSHYAPVRWMLETTMESSVRHHAADVEVPSDVDLRDPALAERAFGHYSVACTPCHGAPGVDAAPWLVLEPPAEPLIEVADRWSDAELYWIVKHGIKMTGMPALGPTHADEDLWAIAAMVRQLPEMSAEEYQAMADRHATRGHAGHGSASATMPDPMPSGPMEAAAPDAAPTAAPAVEDPATPAAIAGEAASRPRSSRPTRRRRPAPSATSPSVVSPPPSAAPQPAPSQHDHHHHHHRQG